ncbi:MAG: hypothetical protein U1G07_20310 [Verrucomicrobiota bacterium]
MKVPNGLRDGARIAKAALSSRVVNQLVCCPFSPEQRRERAKEPPPKGLRGNALQALSFLSHRALRLGSFVTPRLESLERNKSSRT